MSNYDPVPGDDDLQELVNNINQWGLDRNITVNGGATVMSQLSKMMEEFAEFLGHWPEVEECAMDPNEDNSWVDQVLTLPARPAECELKRLIEDDFGDMLVCLIHAMRLAGTDMETCLSKSWEDIKDRGGVMISGKFVKEV